MEQTSEQGTEERVLLDTSVCIDTIKKKQRGISISDQLFDNEIFLSSVSLFELLLRRSNLGAIEALVKRINLIAFDEKSARKASDIAKQLYASGIPIEFRDIFIAATAMANNCALATLNIKDFSKVKGLKLIKLQARP